MSGINLNNSISVNESIDDYALQIGDAGDSKLRGGEAMDIMFGRYGSDALAGGTGEDELMGGAGRDMLKGGIGMDHLGGGNGGDTLYGGTDDDRLEGGNGADYLDEGDGHGDVDGGMGNDTIVGGTGADAFAIDPMSGHDVIKDFVAGPGMFDHLAIMDLTPDQLRFDDTSDGVLISWNDNAGSVLLEGVSKSDLSQDDLMFTDDRYLVRQADSDSNSITAVSYAKNEGGYAQAPAVSGGDVGAQDYQFNGFHVSFGGESQDVFQADNHNDAVFGLGGDDNLFGGAGEDHLDGGDGADTLDGGAGMDDLKGGAGNDALYGGAMADMLMGGDGNDTLYAGKGHDMIDGGIGNDVLNGGDGADAYVVMPDSGNDVVVGGFDAGPGAFDHIAFEDIMPDQVTIAQTDAGVLVSWSTDMGEGSILLQGVHESELAQDDFMFSSVEGGAFVTDPNISNSGSDYIFG